MRGRATALALVVVLALSGCGHRPAGVDGDLTNGWAALGKATTPTPVLGACYNSWQDEVYTIAAVDCATRYHEAETVYVGAFTGADAQRATVPLKGGPARAAAYAQCLKAAADYLGGDPHTAQVYLDLVVPGGPMWRGGAAWYRCDMQGYSDFTDASQIVERSVRDGLRGAAPLRITCATSTTRNNKSVTDFHAVSCARPHDHELAGVYTAPNAPWQADANARDAAESKACEGVVARYLGFGDGVLRSFRVGWLAWGYNQRRWELGDRTELCYAWVSTQGKRVAGSVKGVRAGPPR